MLKYALMASAMMVAAPVIAQEQPASSPTSSTGTTTAPTDQTGPMSTSPTSDPMTAGDPTSTGQSTGTTGTDSTASGGAVAGTTQIAQVVETEFPTYDKNADGALNSSEFGSWMVALRTASDPATKAGSKEMKAWTSSAFAQADIDKSKSVSKAELTGFLAKGQS